MITSQNIMLILGLVFFTSYILYIIREFGVQKSISFSFYKLPKTEKWIFRGLVWFLSAVVIIAGNCEPWLIASGCLLSIVGMFTEPKLLQVM